MDRQYDWMTNRFVQDFVNVSIQGLNLESQSVANGDDLCESGVEHFDVDALIDVKEPINSNNNSIQPVTVIDGDEGLDFDAVVTTGNGLTELGRNYIKKENKLNNPFHSQDGESNFAQHIDNPKAINNSFSRVLDPITNSDLDTIDKNDLEKVRTSTGDRKMELHTLKKEDITSDGAQKYLSPDTTDDLQSFKKRDQKRRPKPKDGTSLFCAICGDRALGYNFDAITCESCKAFFRRNALKTKVFACSFEGNCKLDPHTRKFCSGCRLKKCFEVGMKKDWILSDEQLAKRRKKSRTGEETYLMKTEPHPMEQQRLSPQSMEYAASSQYPIPNTNVFNNTVAPPQGNNSDGEVTTSYLSDSTDNSLSSPGNQILNISTNNVKVEPSPDNLPRPLPPDVEEGIKALELEYQGVFDSGYSELQAKKMVERPHTANELFNMTDIFIRRLIKFAKHIPEFKSLKQEDQIYLLKGGIMEIMVLRSAMGFDPQKLQWKIKQQETVQEHGLDPKIIKEQLGQSMYSDHIQFVTSLHQLTRSNSTIMTLLFVIEVFAPDRPNVISKEEIMHAQEKFRKWLRLYLESIMPVIEARSLYPKLLAKLSDVRQLGESSSKLASHLDITKLEPLLVEVFNLQK